MNKNLFLIFPLILLHACNSSLDEFSSTNGISEIEKLFLQLYYSPYPAVQYGTAINDRLTYKKELSIYVYGNAAVEFKKEIQDTIYIFKPAFNITLTNDSKNADIDLYIYKSDAKNKKIGAFTDAINYMNSYPISAYGKQLAYASNGTLDKIADANAQYAPDYFHVTTFASQRYLIPCAGQFFYKNFEKQTKTYWSETPNAPVTGRPDKIKLYIFSGFYGPEKDKVYASELGATESAVKSVASACFLEEVGHAVTLMGDLHEVGKAGLFAASGAKVNPNVDSEVELNAIMSERSHDDDTLKSLLRIYSRPYIKDGMTKAELIEAFQKYD